jgi:hypothetical protein
MEIEDWSKMTPAERDVAGYLDELGISYEFEYPVFVKDERDRPRLWTPDFYLADIKIYIEICESENPDFEYRKKMYAENKIDIIFLPLFKDDLIWKEHFLELLKTIVNRSRKKLDTLIETNFKK